MITQQGREGVPGKEAGDYTARARGRAREGGR